MGYSARPICVDDLEQIMIWRQDPDITKWMNTDPKLTLEGQKQWLSETQQNQNCRFWVIEVDGSPAGILDYFDLDKDAGVVHWGYYVGAREHRSMALALSLELSLYEHCFDNLGLEIVKNEVFAENVGVIRLHELCGNRIVEVEKDAVEKSDGFHDVVHMEITRETWKALQLPNYEKLDLI